MSVFLILAFLFFIGSIAGWIIELFYRRFISNKKWINPGFLVGPYLPLYGFGLCTFYLLAQINLHPAPLIILMAFVVTLIEYIAGLIFIKGMGVKLWDYSRRVGKCRWTYLPEVYFILGNFGSNLFVLNKSIYSGFVIMASG